MRASEDCASRCWMSWLSNRSVILSEAKELCNHVRRIQPRRIDEGGSKNACTPKVRGVSALTTVAR